MEPGLIFTIVIVLTMLIIIAIATISGIKRKIRPVFLIENAKISLSETIDKKSPTTVINLPKGVTTEVCNTELLFYNSTRYLIGIRKYKLEIGKYIFIELNKNIYLRKIEDILQKGNEDEYITFSGCSINDKGNKISLDTTNWSEVYKKSEIKIIGELIYII